ncbi:MAG: hypothetical protein LBL90_11625 [Prevotellaceae bacterium]|nr:hypothetical protein [Prevotellaceae bacterium]
MRVTRTRRKPRRGWREKDKGTQKAHHHDRPYLLLTVEIHVANENGGCCRFNSVRPTVEFFQAG